jgi:hypothetical protein
MCDVRSLAAGMAFWNMDSYRQVSSSPCCISAGFPMMVICYCWYRRMTHTESGVGTSRVLLDKVCGEQSTLSETHHENASRPSDRLCRRVHFVAQDRCGPGLRLRKCKISTTMDLVCDHGACGAPVLVFCASCPAPCSVALPMWSHG